jgi:cell wall-associated NlpC family hydrolase
VLIGVVLLILFLTGVLGGGAAKADLIGEWTLVESTDPGSKPGDIVLFERTYTSSVRATHAGMYIGNGQFIHAANSRVGVVISSLSETYYSSRFICGRRLG